MKNIMLFLCLCLTGFGLNAQNSKRDSIKNVVSDYVQSVSKAADIFLNRDLPAPTRLKAIAEHPIIYEEKQVAQFKRVVLSNDESPEIRAMALNKIYEQAETDQKLLEQAIQWLGNPETPKPLRNEVLNLIGNLSFSSLVSPLDVYYKMMTDPDLNFMSFAVSKLIMNGDARAQQLLIKGLETPQSALFTAPQAIELLSLSPKKEYYPVVYKLLLESKDEATRLIALQSLGAYKPAREKIAAISLDPNEKEVFRESALMALYSGDKDNITKYVIPILQDKSASARLQVLGIQMAVDTRRSMAYRRSDKAKQADTFDRLVKQINEKAGVNKSDDVVNAANRYLLIVKPNF